jgi:hypothetical protein
VPTGPRGAVPTGPLGAVPTGPLGAVTTGPLGAVTTGEVGPRPVSSTGRDEGGVGVAIGAESRLRGVPIGARVPVRRPGPKVRRRLGCTDRLLARAPGTDAAGTDAAGTDAAGTDAAGGEELAEVGTTVAVPRTVAEGDAISGAAPVPCRVSRGPDDGVAVAVGTGTEPVGGLCEETPELITGVGPARLNTRAATADATIASPTTAPSASR